MYKYIQFEVPNQLAMLHDPQPRVRTPTRSKHNSFNFMFNIYIAVSTFHIHTSTLPFYIVSKKKHTNNVKSLYGLPTANINWCEANLYSRQRLPGFVRISA